jgi:hypothetical protein
VDSKVPGWHRRRNMVSKLVNKIYRRYNSFILYETTIGLLSPQIYSVNIYKSIL